MVIKKGHYQTKASLKSETPEIIRIIGPVKNKEGYWYDMDKNEIPEYILQQQYVYYDTIASEKDIIPQEQKNKKLFADFKPIEIDESKQAKSLESKEKINQINHNNIPIIPNL